MSGRLVTLEGGEGAGKSTVIAAMEAWLGEQGIDYLRSATRQERSFIVVRFKLGRDVEAAANDVRDRVGRMRGRLPDEIDEPIISKVEADALRQQRASTGVSEKQLRQFASALGNVDNVARGVSDSTTRATVLGVHEQQFCLAEDHGE